MKFGASCLVLGNSCLISGRYFISLIQQKLCRSATLYWKISYCWYYLSPLGYLKYYSTNLHGVFGIEKYLNMWAYTGPNNVWVCSWADIDRTCTTFLIHSQNKLSILMFTIWHTLIRCGKLDSFSQSPDQLTIIYQKTAKF